MLLYIGGAARTGKGILVRRLLAELKIITREIAFSRYVMDACARHHMRYFDMSHDFLPTQDQVVAYVRAG